MDLDRFDQLMNTYFAFIHFLYLMLTRYVVYMTNVEIVKKLI